MSIHDGHRSRLRQRFLEEGLEHFSPHQVLELLLFYCIPRKDTNEIACNLINRFGSLSAVLEAPVSELKKVPGMGEASATFLSLIPAVNRYYLTHHDHSPIFMNSVRDYGNYLSRCLQGRRNEMVYMMCLDAKCKLISCREVGEGCTNYASVPIRRIVETALAENAVMVVLAHNHPSGLAIPSDEDIHTTRRLAAALSTVDIVLADHIVVADDDFVSMSQSGIFDPNSTKVLF
ncbi:MAG: DNA repair protein RadC [Oscillospiraceae bacterium]|nr:DNA repair protein RadC [Oscillospiraceae bacterium]